MDFLIIALLIAVGVVPHLLDVISSAANNPYCLRPNPPRIIEGRKMFRLPNGQCHIAKLVGFKFLLLGVCAVVAFGLYLWTDAGLIAFAVFPLMAVVALPALSKNYKLNKKYRALEQSENQPQADPPNMASKF